MTFDLSTRARSGAQPTRDGISARDGFLRGEMVRGSRELLEAMIRELEAMGRLS